MVELEDSNREPIRLAVILQWNPVDHTVVRKVIAFYEPRKDIGHLAALPNEQAERMAIKKQLI